jgi:hypothetical protein
VRKRQSGYGSANRYLKTIQVLQYSPSGFPTGSSGFSACVSSLEEWTRAAKGARTERYFVTGNTARERKIRYKQSYAEEVLQQSQGNGTQTIPNCMSKVW